MAIPQLEENDKLPQEYPYYGGAASYFPVSNIYDIYERDPSTLLASLARFGHAVQSREATIRDTEINAILPTLTRLCENNLSISDLKVLLDKFPLRTYKQSYIFLPYRPDRTTLEHIGDFLQYDQIISYHSINATTWIILLALPKTRSIEIYTIGNVKKTQLDSILSSTNNIYYLLSSGTTYQFRMRLRIPTSFTTDPVWAVYLFLNFLHRNGDYLALTMEKMVEHKLSLVQDLVQQHDNWLGKLHVKLLPQPSFPFVSTQYLDSDRELELNSILEQHGWVVVDVCGDGNCGYYVVVLGLENINNFQYSLRNETARDRAKAIPMSRNTAWQYLFMKLRSDTQRHSQYMIKQVYPIGRRDHAWFYMTGAATDSQIDELSNSFVNPNFQQMDYFNGSLLAKENIEFQMEPYWTAHVLASMLRIRVIVYTRDASWNGVKVTYSWSTTVSAHGTPPEHGIKQHDKIVRPSDVEFKRMPTIEIMYTTGYVENGCPENNHFRWLRRVLWHQLPDQPILAPDRLEQLLPSTCDTNRSESSTEPTVPTNDFPSEQDDQTGDSPVPTNDFPSEQDDQTSESPVRGTSEESFTSRKQRNDHIVVKKRKKVVKETRKKDKTTTKRQKGMGGSIATTMNLRERQQSEKNQVPTRDSELLALTEYFNEQVVNGTYPNAAVTQMYCNAKTGGLSVRNVNENGQFSFPRKCTRLEEFDDKLVESARKYAGTWIGPSIGDACDGEAPDYLNTTTPTLYQQHGKPYCLTYSLASALFYCKFEEEATWILTAAQKISEENHEGSISKIREMMADLVPQIGLATLYGIRTKNSCRIKRELTWEKLLTKVTPYPTLVIPALPNGVTTHAFCVVDDLIFDSITPFALKLCEESVKWIFNGSETMIYEALRFETKVSPKGYKVKGKYNREVVFHWDHPARYAAIPSK